MRMISVHQLSKRDYSSALPIIESTTTESLIVIFVILIFALLTEPLLNSSSFELSFELIASLSGLSITITVQAKPSIPKVARDHED